MEETYREKGKENATGIHVMNTRVNANRKKRRVCGQGCREKTFETQTTAVE